MKRLANRHAAALTGILLTVTAVGFLAGCASQHEGALGASTPVESR